MNTARNKKIPLLSSALIIVLLLSQCSKPHRKPGLCLSFDDRAVKEWYSLRSLLRHHGAKVTFFVSAFDSLSSEELQLLAALRSDGHEIGSHGARHVQAEAYIKQHSYRQYLMHEVDANTAAMRKKGFNPTAFAYPYGSKYWFTDLLLLRRFVATRGVVALGNRELEEADEAFYSFDGNNKPAAAEIDGEKKLTGETIVKAMDRALRNDEVLLLCGHEPNDFTQGVYTFTTDFLSFILDEADRRHLHYYTVSDLVSK